MKKMLLPLLVVVAACSKSDPEPPVLIDSPSLDLRYDETHQFSLMKGNDELYNPAFTWSSSDQLVGNVDTQGEFSARKVGKTTVTARNEQGTFTSEVTVSPYSTFLKDIVLEFGASRSKIKESEKRVYSEDTGNFVYYVGENNYVRKVAYHFAAEKMDAVIVLLTTDNETLSEASVFYQERFPYFEVSDSALVFRPDDEDYEIWLGVDGDIGLYAAYLPGGTQLRTDGKTREKILKDLKQTLQ